MNNVSSNPIIETAKLAASYVPVPKYESLVGANTIKALSTEIMSFLGKPKASSVVSKVLKERVREMGRCSLSDSYLDLPAKGLSLSHVFHTYPYSTVQQRLSSAQMDLRYLGDKLLLQIDHFFNQSEGDELRKIFSSVSYPKRFGTDKQQQMFGEKPAKCLGEENLKYMLSNPPAAADIVHKLFAYMGAVLNVDVSTHPWNPIYTLTNNFMNKNSKESAALGWHQDYDPSHDGTLFSLSKKLNDKTQYYPKNFKNGSPGNPMLFSIILYTTAENFKPEYGMGTKFKSPLTTLETIIPCEHMRIALFEGDLLHCIQEDFLSQGINTWRNTLVWRITLRPKGESNISIKEAFTKFITPLVKNVIKETPALITSSVTDKVNSSFLADFDEDIVTS